MALPVRKFDAVIVGAGGAGLRASSSSPRRASRSRRSRRCSRRARTRWRRRAASAPRSATWARTAGSGTCTTPSRARTASGDQDAIEFMCRMAPEVVIELEHFGMPFDRNENGTIYQRPFGGHSANFGEKPVQRSSCAADRTGHAMLHALYQRNVHRADAVLRRVDGARPHPRHRGPRARRDRARDGDRRGRDLPGARPRSSPPAAAGASSRPRPTPSSTPATAWAWRRAPASRSRTWSSGSSTRPASPARACSSPRACAARAATCSTRTASASWSATRRP